MYTAALNFNPVFITTGAAPGTGMIVLFVALTAVISYFLGCFNGSVIVSKYVLKDDIRTHGSGNAGFTNFYRVFGGGLTFVVILTDMLKAVIAVLIGAAVFGGLGLSPLLGKYFAGTCCMLGHMFPCTFGFKGGKGVLSGGAVAIMVDWRLALIVWGGFLILAILTKWVSLGSCYAGAAFPVATWFLFQDILCTLLALVCGVIILWRHRANLKRIFAGTESKFSFHHKGDTKS